jgi:hypothetical protein
VHRLGDTPEQRLLAAVTAYRLRKAWLVSRECFEDPV